jgi:hypothetical protein
MIRISVSDQEFATIIASLRFYQEMGQGEPDKRSDDIHELATDGDNVVSLDAEGIDDLAERINCEYEELPDTDPRAENLTGENPAFPRAMWREQSEAGKTDLVYWQWVSQMKESQPVAAGGKERTVEVIVCESHGDDTGGWYTEYVSVPADTPDDQLEKAARDAFFNNFKEGDNRIIAHVGIYCEADPFAEEE